VPRPTNPGGPGKAVDLTGNAESGKAIFAANCAICHAAEGKGGNPNPGSTDTTIPPLNPIDPLLWNADQSVFRTNVDLFIEHGSTPDGPGPTFSMPAWGDKQLLMPQQIADVIAYVVGLNPAPQGAVATSAPAAQPSGTAAAGSGGTPTEEASGVPRPTNPGGPGQAVSLTGDVNAGAAVFSANCAVCHGAQGTGGNPNPGSTDGTIPPLNPIDPLLKDPDPVVFKTNVDLFLEHGSTPDGPGPTFSMPAWGDKKLLMPQQIADVIAYVLSLNK
jgi:mono/diheme cytochrome c family protein